ncbi:unannotated protein [freshwater metagenome]|uniref:Unannotated protein n=1 Tax=freshwater metagenome TaxID=449393 RepID=A0A6J6Q7W9_9ZZZZ
MVVAAAATFALLAWWRVPWDVVPGGRLQPVPADQVYSSAEIQRAEEYARWARLWSRSSLVVSVVLAGWLGFGRTGRTLVARLPGRWWLQVPLAVLTLAVIARVVTLPFAVALRRHQLDYGLSTQGWAGFARDLVLHEAVQVVVTSLGLLALIFCMRRWRRRWPAIAGATLGVLVLLGSFVYPVLVEPLFSSFTPLPDGDLRSRILAVAAEEGVQVDDVLVADASRRTTTLNAYVSGFGSTRRVVVYDTLVDDLSTDQAVSVVAHELTHARYDDVLTGSLLGACGAALAVGLLGLLLGRRPEDADEPQAPELPVDGRVVPRVLALLAIGTLLASPVQNTVSRQIETRADLGALEATRDPEAFISMQRELGLRSLADPTPSTWSQVWFGSHPTGLTRIALAERMAQRMSGSGS